MNTRELVQFKMAYSWMFGVSENKAQIVYHEMKAKCHQFYIEAVIDGYKNAIKAVFYAD